jgi:hypothetical protein
MVNAGQKGVSVLRLYHVGIASVFMLLTKLVAGRGL